MNSKQLIARYVAQYQSKKAWRAIAREAQALGGTPVWRLMIGAGLWPSRLSMPSRGVRF